jgi:hypothetical protein
MMDTWRIEIWTAAKIASAINGGGLIVPRFQRDLVWSDEEKSEFVDTLKSGFPFGSILLYECGEYLIIDGRISSCLAAASVEEPTWDDEAALVWSRSFRRSG